MTDLRETFIPLDDDHEGFTIKGIDEELNARLQEIYSLIDRCTDLPEKRDVEVSQLRSGNSALANDYNRLITLLTVAQTTPSMIEIGNYIKRKYELYGRPKPYPGTVLCVLFGAFIPFRAPTELIRACTPHYAGSVRPYDDGSDPHPRKCQSHVIYAHGRNAIVALIDKGKAGNTSAYVFVPWKTSEKNAFKGIPQQAVNKLIQLGISSASLWGYAMDTEIPTYFKLDDEKDLTQIKVYDVVLADKKTYDSEQGGNVTLWILVFLFILIIGALIFMRKSRK